MDNKKKNDKTLGVAMIVIAVFLALFLGFALVVPAITAKARLNDKLEAYRALGEDDIMQIFDPLYKDGGFYGDVTAELSSDESKEIAQKLLNICDGAKYSSIAADVQGNWDVSIVVRKDGGGISSVYFTEDEFYVTKDNKQYRFKPAKDKTEEFSSLVALIEERIAQSSKNVE